MCDTAVAVIVSASANVVDVVTAAIFGFEDVHDSQLMKNIHGLDSNPWLCFISSEDRPQWHLRCQSCDNKTDSSKVLPMINSRHYQNDFITTAFHNFVVDVFV